MEVNLEFIVGMYIKLIFIENIIFYEFLFCEFYL